MNGRNLPQKTAGQALDMSGASFGFSISYYLLSSGYGEFFPIYLYNYMM
jgi:hypothetical protein